jgi:hypothetical protein
VDAAAQEEELSPSVRPVMPSAFKANACPSSNTLRCAPGQFSNSGPSQIPREVSPNRTLTLTSSTFLSPSRPSFVSTMNRSRMREIDWTRSRSQWQVDCTMFVRLVPSSSSTIYGAKASGCRSWLKNSQFVRFRSIFPELGSKGSQGRDHL